MRQCAEDERATVEVRVVVCDEADLLRAKTYPFALPLIGGGEMELEAGMARDEGAQLSTGVAGRAEHPDGNFMHGE
jgi:hypothetical protein